MIKLVIKVLVSGLAVLLTSALSIGIQTDGYSAAIMAAIVIGILDWAIKTVSYTHLTLPTICSV